MAATKTLMTAEDLLAMPDNAYRELVNGELVQMSPPSRDHGRTSLKLGSRLLLHVEANNLGECHVETGFVLSREPDTVRSPDVSFVERTRAKAAPRGGFFPFPPDLAVEVVSPGDTWTEVEAKVEEYLAAGMRLVWVVEPGGQKITVYRPDGTRPVFHADDEITGEDVIPGFAARVGSFFE